MAWFRVDDKFHGGRKRKRAGLEAVGLWTVCGSWSSDQLEDGFVPDYVVDEFAPRNGRKLAASLVAAGLWDPETRDDEEGWRFHDWTDYNPTRAQVEERRAFETQRKAEWRAAKKAKADDAGRPHLEAVAR